MASAARKGSRRRSTPRAKFVKRYQRLEEMPIVHRQAAGLDLAGAASHFVAIEIGEEIEVREFGGTTDEVKAMVTYLVTQGITSVAMEATGVYWMVVYDLLEAAGLEVFLVNPSHAKNVPGRRKDDKLDCRWLQKLHKYGMLSASFRPDPEDRPLHSLHRQRLRLVQLATDEVRRMQKALDIMNLRIHKVLSDLVGVTGLRLIRAILAGERDPAVLAQLRDPRCSCTPAELEAALTGHYLPAQCTALRQALARYELLLQQVAELDGEIEAILRAWLPWPAAEIDARLAEAGPGPRTSSHHQHAPAFPVVAYVEGVTGQDPTVLPGIGPHLALSLLAETGRNLEKWPTVKHFTSYATLAPVQKISGGKLLSSRTRAGVHPLAILFRQAAATVSRSDTALGAFYRRLAVRVGRAKALTATARKIAEQYYYLMRYGRAYVEHDAQRYEERYRQRQIAGVLRKAEQLGLTLVPAA